MVSFLCWFDVLHILPCPLPLPSLYRYNWRKTSGRKLTNWQSDLIENTINPTLARAFNLTSLPTNSRPINPLLNPKAFLFYGQCATHCHKSPSASALSRPHPCCVCVCVCMRRDESEFRHSWHHHPITYSALGISVNALAWTDYLHKVRQTTHRAVQPAGLPCCHWHSLWFCWWYRILRTSILFLGFKCRSAWSDGKLS